jgi:hypothetical protein
LGCYNIKKASKLVIAMRHNPKRPFYLQMRFNSFDHFAHTVRGWDLDFHQLDRGSFRADLRQVETDAALVIHALFNRKLEQSKAEGRRPEGGHLAFWSHRLLKSFCVDK